MNMYFLKSTIFFCCIFLFSSAQGQSETFNPIEDAYIRGGENANQNYNNHTDGLVVKQGTVAGFFRKSLIKFDISSYTLEQAESAVLRLYCYKIERNDVVTSIDAYAISSDWSESSVTWATAPVFGQMTGSATAVPDTYIELRVSDYVRDAISNKVGEISFGLFDKSASNNGIFINDRTGENPPELIISVEKDTIPDHLTGTYYVDAENGDDLNSGLTESDAWKTLQHLNRQIFGPGARLLFKAGQEWEGTFQPSGKGAEGNPFVIGSYGEGARPAIHGNGAPSAIHIRNTEYFILRDLEVTNYNASEEDGLTLLNWEENNVAEWFEADNPPQYTSGNTMKTGVRITATDMGEVNQIHLDNLHVHGVNGAINQSSEETKNNGGIFIEITGSEVPTWFNGLLIENCLIHDVDRTGLSNTSSWSTRTLTTNENWTPSLNFVIRNNVFERAGANALIVRVAKDPLIENNLFHQNGIKGSGNAAFNFNTDGAVWQFNESRFTKKNQNDADAGGIDSDYRTKNTIIQYNYIHDNDFGMLVTGGPSNYGGFNDSTIIRYNIFERDGLVQRDGESKFAFKISGRATNTFIHNNVFYLAPEQSEVNLVYHRNWGGSPARSYYYNNIFYLEGNNHGYDFGNSTANYINDNIFYGNPTIDWPEVSLNILANPAFISPGTGPEGYKIGEDSPAIKKGVARDKVGSAPFDYFGNPVPRQGNVDIGIHQFSTISTGNITIPEGRNGNLLIKPMPVTDKLHVHIEGMSENHVLIYLVSLSGERIYLGSKELFNGKGSFVYRFPNNSLNPGMYALKVVSENQVISRKLIYAGN